jgi:hypothetical protein
MDINAVYHICQKKHCIIHMDNPVCLITKHSNPTIIYADWNCARSLDTS